VGTGGVFGMGLMQGKQKLMFLPDRAHRFYFRHGGRRAGAYGDRPRLIIGFPGDFVAAGARALHAWCARRFLENIWRWESRFFDCGAGVDQHERGGLALLQPKVFTLPMISFWRQFAPEHAGFLGNVC